jgi:hypothetical protein
MPVESQLLYFHLGMNADDDGFIANTKMIQRTIGASNDSIKILFAKKFLVAFDNGICVIKHWRINNFIRKDIYKPTKYLGEKNRLFIRENGAYTLRKDGASEIPQGHFTLEGLFEKKPMIAIPKTTLTERQRDVNIGKVRKGKESKDNTCPTENKSFDIFWEVYPKKELKKRSKEIWTSKNLSEKLPEILAFLEQAKLTVRWRKGYIKQPPAFLNGECWNDDIAAYNIDYDKKQVGNVLTTGHTKTLADKMAEKAQKNA